MPAAVLSVAKKGRLAGADSKRGAGLASEGASGRRHQRIVVLGSAALVSFRGPMLRAMVERGHTVTACAPAARTAVIEALAAMGVAYRDVPLDRHGLRPDRDLRAVRALVALFRELQPDIFLGYTIKPVIYGSLAAWVAGVPHRFSMITGLGYAFGGGGLKARVAGTLARLLYRLAMRRNDRVFFQNPDDRALFERAGLLRAPEQAVLINGSGVDLEAFAPAPLPRPPSFLLLARLIGEKGVREYVEAARIIRARHPGTTFRLAGRLVAGHPAAISERELRAWVEEGIIDHLGWLDDVRPAIAASSVYVLPSYYPEGTPRSVLEAMAMGRPIVTADAPGCRETVQDGVNGYLVPVRDVPALVGALERFLVAPGSVEAMGRASRQIAVEKYDVHKVNAIILEAMGLAE